MKQVLNGIITCAQISLNCGQANLLVNKVVQQYSLYTDSCSILYWVIYITLQ